MIAARVTGPLAVVDSPSSNAPTEAVIPSWDVPGEYQSFPRSRQVSGTAEVAKGAPDAVALLPATWWRGIPVLALLLAWWLGHGQSFWDAALLMAARGLLVGAVILGMVAASRWIARRGWHATLGPALTGGMVLLLAGTVALLGGPAVRLQAQIADAQGNPAQAVRLSQHIGDADGVARAQIAWGKMLTDQGQFAAAKTHLQAALNGSGGDLHDQARSAMGHLLLALGAGGSKAGRSRGHADAVGRGRRHRHRHN